MRRAASRDSTPTAPDPTATDRPARRRARDPVRHARRVALAAAVACCVSGAADRRPCVLEDEGALLPAENANLALAARRLRFPGPVLESTYCADAKVLVATFSYGVDRPRRWGRGAAPRGRCVAYDLARRVELWAKDQDLRPIMAAGDRLLAHRGKRIALLDLHTGREIRSFSAKSLLLARDTILLVSYGREVQRIDPRTGEPVWSRWIGSRRSPSGVHVRDSTIYLVSSGVYAMDHRDGSGWGCRLPAVRSNRTSTFIANILSFALTLELPRYWGTTIVMEPDGPLLRQGRVFAAADTEAVCLLRETGQVLWRRRLGPVEGARVRQAALAGTWPEDAREWPGAMLVRDAGDHIALLGIGIVFDRSRTWRADPPSLALLDPGTGATRRRVRIGNEWLVLDYLRVEGAHLVLGPRNLLVFDDDLAIRDTIPLPPGHREWRRFVTEGSAVFVTTNAGVLELDPEARRAVWCRSLGGVVRTHPARAPDDRSWFAGRLGLIGHSPIHDTEFVSIPLDGGMTQLAPNAVLVTRDSTVTVAWLPW